MKQPEWVEGLFSAIDAMDTQRFLGFLDEDATFRFGNQPPLHGKEAIGKGVDGFFETIGGCRHHIAKTWSDHDTTICKGEVSYTRKDGSEIMLPFANIFGMNGEQIREYSIYIDITPLYA